MRRTTTTLIIGIILSFIGLAYLCCLLFSLAVYALPFFVGVTAGLAAYHSGSVPIAAIIVGSVILVVGRIAFTSLRSPLMRAVLAVFFAVPAAVARYHAAGGLAHLLVAAEACRDAVAIAGATIVAATVFMGMQFSSPPGAERSLPPA